MNTLKFDKKKQPSVIKGGEHCHYPYEVRIELGKGNTVQLLKERVLRFNREKKTRITNR